MIKITLEYHTPAEAIVALNAIMHLPEVKVSDPLVEALHSSVKKARRGRADKGKSREPYKPRAPEPSTPASAIPEQGKTTGNSASAVTESRSAGDPGAASSTVAQAPKETASAIAGTPAAATATTAGVPITPQMMQEAMEKVFAAKGIDVARTLLADFGVGRIRDVKEADRSTFMQKAAELCK